MKTKIILFAVLLAFVGNSANAQLFDLASNKDRLTVGFQLGSAGVNTDYGGFAWGVSASLVGVYLDFLIAGPQHQNDKHVNNILWQDDEAFTINVGYQIPVLPWLRVAPIIGYCQTNYGKTDATTVNIETNENNSQMYHDYDVTLSTSSTTVQDSSSSPSDTSSYMAYTPHVQSMVASA